MNAIANIPEIGRALGPAAEILFKAVGKSPKTVAFVAAGAVCILLAKVVLEGAAKVVAAAQKPA